MSQKITARLNQEKTYLEQLEFELNLIRNTAYSQGLMVHDGQREPLDAAIAETKANIHTLERALELISIIPAKYNPQ